MLSHNTLLNTAPQEKRAKVQKIVIQNRILDF